MFNSSESLANIQSSAQTMGLGHRSLFVVGDDAQSIYGFRGSKIEIILNFERIYPQTKEIILNQNYRSVQSILNLAEKILTHNPLQKKKELFTDNNENFKVQYFLARNEREEAEYIIKTLHQTYNQTSDNQSPPDKGAGGYNDELTFVPEEDVSSYYDQKQASKQFDLKTGPKNNKPADSVSAMFDVYLETTDFGDSFGGNNSNSYYASSNWQIPSYDFSNMPGLNNSAILYRTHFQSRSIEETFLKYNVPYRLVSGIGFLDRREVKDVLAVLRFISNGEDKLSLSRFLPLIIDGVGPKTMEKILAYLEDFDYPLAPKYTSQIQELFTKIHTLWGEKTSLIEFTKALLNVIGYDAYLKKTYPIKEEYMSRAENIAEIYSLMLPIDSAIETDGSGSGPNLADKLTQFLAQISLMSNTENAEKDQTPKINLMSLHQSKGLEFETVFLVGVEDGLLPHANSLYEPGGLEEEVRLSYVGVTRAKKYLHLISAESRIQFGQVKANPVSRIFRPFLDKYCERVR